MTNLAKRRFSLRNVARTLALFYTAFISLFALDVFGEGYGFWETLLALLIHLLPAVLILVVLTVAWKWARAGGFVFIALGLFYVAAFWGESDLVAYLLVAGPCLLIGCLFLFDNRLKPSRLHKV